MNTQTFFLISHSGHEITLWILLFLSVVSVAVTLERFFYLRLWENSLKEVSKEIQKSDEPEAWIRIFGYVNLRQDLNLKRIARYLEEKPHLAKDVMKSFVLSKKVFLESKLNILSSTGSNAPFIGLLGTIFGVMEAFYSLGISSESATPVVMQGISKALLATAVGLMVAIPAVVFYNFLRRKVQKILDDFEYLQSIIEICAKITFQRSNKNLSNKVDEINREPLDVSKKELSQKSSSSKKQTSFGEKPLHQKKSDPKGSF